MNTFVIVLVSSLTAITGFLAGWLIKSITGGDAGQLEEIEPDIDSVAKLEEKTAEITAFTHKFEKLETELEKVKTENQQKLLQLKERENSLDRREKDLEVEINRLRKEKKSNENALRNLEEKRNAITDKIEHLDKLAEEYESKLQRMSGFTREEAKRLLMSNLRSKVKFEAAQMIKEIKDEARTKGEEEAKKIIAMAILRLAADETMELTTNEIDLPNDDIKGRIIGRDGKNIKSFEKEAGVKVIIDETPKKVILSSFDAIKREVARIAMDKLIKNGKFSPEGIKKAIRNSENEVNRKIDKAGNRAIDEVKLKNIPKDMMRLMGRLQFRTSYGQNVLRHSIEVAKLTGTMAAELGLNVKLAKRAGFFHDIGKAIDRDTEGAHPEIGIGIAKKYKEHEVVINAIASHHEDVEATSIISVLVAAADAVSGSRPGARRRSAADYIHRIEELEHVANSVNGVASSYAIQAGREVRVIAMEDKVKDVEVQLLASEISNRIQSELEYPGKIKVVVIREKRAVEYAN